MADGRWWGEFIVKDGEFIDELVRCKDCKYWSGEYCCDFMTTDINGFCSWGERKEDE